MIVPKFAVFLNFSLQDSDGGVYVDFLESPKQG